MYRKMYLLSSIKSQIFSKNSLSLKVEASQQKAFLPVSESICDDPDRYSRSRYF